MSQPRLTDCDRSYSAAILHILNDAILYSTALWDYEPRSEASMSAWFDVKESNGYPVIGAVDERGALLGFATYGAFRPFAAYQFSAEHSVYVHPQHRRRGVGRLLLQALVARARERGVHTLIAGIDADNQASRALHQELGFVSCGVVRQAGYKFERWLDLEFQQLLLGP